MRYEYRVELCAHLHDHSTNVNDWIFLLQNGESICEETWLFGITYNAYDQIQVKILIFHKFKDKYNIMWI